MNSLYYQKRLLRNIGDKFFTSLSVICSLIAILPLIFLVTYILIKGGSQITPDLFTLEPNPPGDDLDAGGINPALIGTLIITTIASIIAIPVGVGGGIYLAKYIPPPTPTGMAIIEAMVVIISVPINAGLIPPASKSSPGGFGSKVNRSGVI